MNTPRSSMMQKIHSCSGLYCNGRHGVDICRDKKVDHPTRIHATEPVKCWRTASIGMGAASVTDRQSLSTVEQIEQIMRRCRLGKHYREQRGALRDIHTALAWYTTGVLGGMTTQRDFEQSPASPPNLRINFSSLTVEKHACMRTPHNHHGNRLRGNFGAKLLQIIQDPSRNAEL